MRQASAVGLVLAAGLLVAGQVNAVGGRHGRGGAASWSACGGGVAAAEVVIADCASHVVAGPVYEERQVTAYRYETKTRTVERTIQRVVPRTVEEAFTYTEMVPVTTPEKRKETVYKQVTRQVPYKYTVQVPVMTPEKRTVTEYQTVSKQVPHTYTVNIPVISQQKQTQTFYTCFDPS